VLVALVPALLALSNEKALIPQFIDITPTSGIKFRHLNGDANVKKYIFEAKGGGAAFLDYDNDGWMDVLLVQGSTLERFKQGSNPGPALYRNKRDGTFEDVTPRSGLKGGRGWGMGVTVADYDNDGLADIYLTNLGPNVLYRNNGDGTFTDVSEKAGVEDARWGTSAAFGDYDGDGYLIYTCNYLDMNFTSCLRLVLESFVSPGQTNHLRPKAFRIWLMFSTATRGMAHSPTAKSRVLPRRNLFPGLKGRRDNDHDLDLWPMTPNRTSCTESREPSRRKA
jgi:hypothetical protein